MKKKGYREREVERGGKRGRGERKDEEGREKWEKEREKWEEEREKGQEGREKRERKNKNKKKTVLEMHKKNSGGPLS